ncbi:hypothetical protein L484_015109 [Morus notabilis]|uniref:Uncharacterized protein n=1 Tax=Morus notabilis TaxID=981085 RepID=W9SHE9_9ROSA|nr:hypothetical protein L484_015109 [Morus notabilis]
MDPHLILLQIISSPYKNGVTELSVFQRINGNLSEVDAQVCCVFDAATVARLHGRHGPLVARLTPYVATRK